MIDFLEIRLRGEIIGAREGRKRFDTDHEKRDRIDPQQDRSPHTAAAVRAARRALPFIIVVGAGLFAASAARAERALAHAAQYEQQQGNEDAEPYHSTSVPQSRDCGD